jgi:hypothetical protein
MGRDQDAGQFEWVNVWASASGATTDAVTVAPETEIVAAPKPAAPKAAAPATFARFTATSRRDTGTPAPTVAPFAVAPLPDQLMRDIAEIERARDALAAGPLGRRMRAFMVVPSRTTDSVPLLVGGVLALVMLSVFATAAAVTKFGR